MKKINSSIDMYLNAIETKKIKGKLYALVPHEDLIKIVQALTEADDKVFIPDEVVHYNIIRGRSLIASWRIYFNLSQHDLAKRLGVSQPTIAKFERSDQVKLTTLKRISDAMGIEYEQLCD